MILAITDGVGLTSKLAAEPAKAGEYLSTFFRAQIQAFDAFACGSENDSHWRIVKTTGDGLIFAAIDDAKCNMTCKQTVYERFLSAIHATADCSDLISENIGYIRLSQRLDGGQMQSGKGFHEGSIGA